MAVEMHCRRCQREPKPEEKLAIETVLASYGVSELSVWYCSTCYRELPPRSYYAAKLQELKQEHRHAKVS